MLYQLKTTLAACLAFAACSPRSPGGGSPPQQHPVNIVILVSLDGFRFDYLDRHPAPNLKRLAASGVRARWMMPSFPTLTFPNHYTIVTGLTPAHHGIVGNSFMDPSDGARFRRSDTLVALLPRWWGGEPLWVTAVRQGRRSAAFFWPGSDAEIAGFRPTYWKRYEGRVPNANRVDTVLAWLALPEQQRPAFVTLYFSDTDTQGHEHGPETPELAAAVWRVDSMMGRLMDGVTRQGLDDRVHIIVVSDHGMTPTSNDRRVVLDDYLDRNSVNAVSLGQFISLVPNDNDTARVLQALAHAPHIAVYPASGAPDRWRYRGNPRISPVVGVAESGWTLTTRAAMSATGRGADGGAHGYDLTDPLMRATFIAAGPSLRRGVVAEPFSNLHVYELICAILGLRPAPNDGSLDSVRTLLR